MSILRIKDNNGKIIEIPALKGESGKSAYELYKEIYTDYTGTLEEWLESLKGNIDLSEYATKEYVTEVISAYDNSLLEIIGGDDNVS